MAENTLKIYGSALSPPTRSVLIFCKLHNIPYELINVDLTNGKQKSPEFLAINPYGLIPAITHGNFSLGECGAIVYYLAEVFNINSQWFPSDLYQKTKINESMHWHHTNTWNAIIPYTFNKVISPNFFHNPPISAEFEAKILRNLHTFLQSLNDLFATGIYIAKTHNPTYADILLYSHISHLEMAKFDFSPYNALIGWREEIGSIEAVRQIHEPFREEIDQWYKLSLITNI